MPMQPSSRRVTIACTCNFKRLHVNVSFHRPFLTSPNSMTNYFFRILLRWYWFNCIVFVHYFIIDNNNWLCISFFLKINECIEGNFDMNVDTRKVRIFHNMITVWCIQIILFATVDVWVNSSTSTLLKNVQNRTSLFPSWQRKNHNYLFYFLKILPQYNEN